MPTYLIHFNQQWVGEHPEEWFRSRVPTSMAVIEEMQAAGIYLLAGGMADRAEAAAADATSGEVVITDGPFGEPSEWLGGFTAIEVPDDETARYWAGRLAEGCGWPQEVRRFA